MGVNAAMASALLLGSLLTDGALSADEIGEYMETHFHILLEEWKKNTEQTFLNRTINEQAFQSLFSISTGSS